MATLNCFPNGAGSSTQWTANGAATNWQCVTSNDADTSYIRIGADSTDQRDYYTVDYSALPANAIISNIQLTIRGRREVSSGSFNRIIKANGTASTDANATFGTTYTTQTRNFATNPTTGVAWVYLDLASLEIGVGVTVSGGNYARATYIYITITYTLPSASNKIFLLG